MLTAQIDNLVIVNGLSRSGNHVFIEWFLSALSKTSHKTIFLNNLKPTICNFWNDIDIPATKSFLYVHNDAREKFSIDANDALENKQVSEAFVSGAKKSCPLVLISLENKTYEYCEKFLKLFVNAKQKQIVFVLRDIFNLFASRFESEKLITQKSKYAKQAHRLEKSKQLYVTDFQTILYWKNNVKAVVENQVCGVIYNRFITQPKYRMFLAKSLFDKPYDIKLQHNKFGLSKGSSFVTKDFMNRWKAFAKHSLMQQMAQSKVLVKLNVALFGLESFDHAFRKYIRQVQNCSVSLECLATQDSRNAFQNALDKLTTFSSVFENYDQITSTFKKMAPLTNLEPSFSSHRGQYKLLMSEIQFLSKYRNAQYVVYAGSASGRHITHLMALFPKVNFLLIDSNKHAYISPSSQYIYTKHFQQTNDARDKLQLVDSVAYDAATHEQQMNQALTDLPTKLQTWLDSKRISIIEDYLTESLAKKIATANLPNMLFISDIRTSLEGNIHPIDIIANNCLEMLFVNILKPHKALLKFRCPVFWETQKISTFNYFLTSGNTDTLPDTELLHEYKRILESFRDVFKFDPIAELISKKQYRFLKPNAIYTQVFKQQYSSEARIELDGTQDKFASFDVQEWDHVHHWHNFYRHKICNTELQKILPKGSCCCLDCTLEFAIYCQYFHAKDISGSIAATFSQVTEIDKLFKVRQSLRKSYQVNDLPVTKHATKTVILVDAQLKQRKDNVVAYECTFETIGDKQADCVVGIIVDVKNAYRSRAFNANNYQWKRLGNILGVHNLKTLIQCVLLSVARKKYCFKEMN